MTDDEKDILQELANALQAASARATHIRRTLGESVEDAVQVEAATDRAVRLIRRLQPKDRT